MRAVDIRVVPTRDGAVERMTVSVESRYAGGWVVKDSWDVMAGTPEATRTLMIEDTDRVVLEAQAEHAIVYDKEQMSATLAPIDEEATKRQEAYNEEQAKRYDEMVKKDEEAKAEKKPPRKTNLGNEAEDQTGAHKEKPSSPMGKAGGPLSSHDVRETHGEAHVESHEKGKSSRR